MVTDWTNAIALQACAAISSWISFRPTAGISPQPGTHVNASGELVDAWDTPYFSHQISGSEMEIHSAGPDKVMWTSDDLVVN
jgi:hypothetical protein